MLDFYWIDMKYIRDLHNIDERVLSVSPQIGKDERPFLGLFWYVKGINIVFRFQNQRRSMATCETALILRK